MMVHYVFEKQLFYSFIQAVLSAQDAVGQLGKAEQEKEYLEKELSYLQVKDWSKLHLLAIAAIPH